MKFGSVKNPGQIDFSLPEDHPGTKEMLARQEEGSASPAIHIGCAKWNRKELKNFYPRGTKDELEFYASRFNAIELNATFYRNFPQEVVEDWYDKVPEDFRFFPKVYQAVSHWKWLSDVEQATEEYLNSVLHFKDKLGTVFLQLRGDFRPKFFDRVVDFVEIWPGGMPLAIEFRHTDWFNDPEVSADLYSLLEENGIANVLVDTAGRRDLLHMRLTGNEAFIRYVGANHETDYTRLDEWLERLKEWVDLGLRKIHFFVHQNDEQASPILASHFIRGLNRELDAGLTVPVEEGDGQGKRF